MIKRRLEMYETEDGKISIYHDLETKTVNINGEVSSLGELADLLNKAVRLEKQAVKQLPAPQATPQVAPQANNNQIVEMNGQQYAIINGQLFPIVTGQNKTNIPEPVAPPPEEKTETKMATVVINGREQRVDMSTYQAKPEKRHGGPPASFITGDVQTFDPERLS